jgi:hypothetical protein
MGRNRPKNVKRDSKALKRARKVRSIRQRYGVTRCQVFKTIYTNVLHIHTGFKPLKRPRSDPGGDEGVLSFLSHSTCVTCTYAYFS